MKKVELLPMVSALCMIGFVSSADAFSIVNRDAEPHMLTIIEGNDHCEFSLEPYGRAADLCSSTCNVIVDDGPDSYEVALDDALSI